MFRNRALASAGLALSLVGTPASATEPREGGLNELVIYKPGTHAEGLPGIEFERKPNGLSVEIAPTVHVHRYYYSGNKEFQGPYVNGGPTMIVANHPKSGEKVYIETNLPAGYPEIAYDRDSITYIYPERRVVVEYSNHHRNKVSVRFESGRGLGRKFHEQARIVAERKRDRKEKSELTRVVRESRKGVVEVAKGATKGVGAVAAKAGETVGGLVSGLPGIEQLRGLGRQAPAVGRETAIANAADTAERNAAEFVPTVR